MKFYLREGFIILMGLAVMALLLYLGALSESWLAVLCFLGVAVVFHSWYRHLLSLARRHLGCDPDDDEQPPFPG